MALSFPSVKRLQLIKDFGLNTYKSKKEFLHFLEQREVYISSRTLNRDFTQLKDLGFEVDFDVQKQKHFITDSFADKQSLLDRLVELESTRSFEKNYAELYQQYVIDGESKSQGLEYIRPLFDAVDKQLTLNFNYHKFNGTQSKRRLYPLQLKLSQHRWYIIGHDLDRKAHRVFGLDRIKNLEIKDKFDIKLIPEHTMTELKLQKFYLGISKHIFEEDKIQRIVLKVSPSLIEYWKSKPIHFTQDIIETTPDGYAMVELTLVPNVDLIRLILSSLGDIEVIEPKSINEHIKAHHSNFLEKFI
jgi:predicted DNA-binding transcriptional regulator YafY